MKNSQKLNFIFSLKDESKSGLSQDDYSKLTAIDIRAMQGQSLDKREEKFLNDSFEIAMINRY